MSDESAAPDPSSVECRRRWEVAGDREALERLLGAEVDALKRHIQARGRLPPSLSASDVAQEAVLNLVKVREPPSFQEPAALRAYLWKSALRLLAAHYERAGARLERLDASASQAAGTALATTGGLGAVEAGERALALEFALHLLEPEEQQLLRLVYFEQVPLEHVAERLSVSYETAKKRLSRARARLALKLGDWSERLG
jgi:RNA polymerase sigma factor (sigma-70 family)